MFSYGELNIIEKERRALAVRCNMIALNLNVVIKYVKITLFMAYYHTFYTGSLWVTVYNYVSNIADGTAAFLQRVTDIC